MITEAWLIRHSGLMRASYRHWTGRDLIPAAISEQHAAAFLDQAPFGLVSHDTAADPVFNYANRPALQLFERSWDDFTRLPSRLSAEPVLQSERGRLLERVAQQGYIDDYSGVRISGSGRRFHIENATVWNLLDEAGKFYGQAALIRAWRPLE